MDKLNIKSEKNAKRKAKVPKEIHPKKVVPEVIHSSGDELNDDDETETPNFSVGKNFLTNTPYIADLTPRRILKLMKHLKDQSNELSFISTDEFEKVDNKFLATKLKLINGSADYYLQFAYASVPNICVCFNGAGVYINGEWDSVNEKANSVSLNELTPKHRAVILAP